MPREKRRGAQTPAGKQRAAFTAPSARGAAHARSVSTPLEHKGSGRAAARRIRIVGGLWKRTPIAVAAVAGLRPTPDRVRETLFNWLAFLRPDSSGLRGLDLFAGTGVLGFELASRGARSVVLVERDPALVARLVALKERLDARQIEIVAGEALAVAARLPRASFDIVFLDPPFDSGLLLPALERVAPLVAPDGLVYAESAHPLTPEQARTLGFEPLRSGRAGRVRFHLLRKMGS
jgi:16S rRNA (guanine(966)-N(2))-methyltransferase RsmD